MQRYRLPSNRSTNGLQITNKPAQDRPKIVDLPRPVWIVLFAVVLFLISNLGAIRPASGQCCFPLADDGMSEFWQPANPVDTLTSTDDSTRPYSLQMFAAPANLDSDADMDG
ncbi:hypothetical protein Q31b_36080 [Novipirellula aureliae]|uniref:Uncharacterized protein n=1 Tax=Novipirellula aureliae TaxID=2527966 RepID=A0A5C6DU87_9BACT|nr:hypothetical protein [Novipirellula aureliae]TWU40262.1 hypothetical protein Q31b_36080 [Novipirellula aureliae]